MVCIGLMFKLLTRELNCGFTVAERSAERCSSRQIFLSLFFFEFEKLLLKILHAICKQKRSSE